MTVTTTRLNPLRRAAVRESLKSSGSSGQEPVLGLPSLVFWALMVVVTLKYVCFVMRADNDGEGGIIALGGLASSAAPDERRRRWLVLIGLAGAALFYGDGAGRCRASLFSSNSSCG